MVPRQALSVGTSRQQRTASPTEPAIAVNSALRGVSGLLGGPAPAGLRRGGLQEHQAGGVEASFGQLQALLLPAQGLHRPPGHPPQPPGVEGVRRPYEHACTVPGRVVGRRGPAVHHPGGRG
jgi:hypothetical protein